MHFLNHGLPHYFSKVVHHHHPEAHVLYHSSSLHVWPSELVDKADRFVEMIESCSAHTMTPGHDGCPPTVDKGHHHTFLRVTVAPSGDQPEEIIFVERVLKEGKSAPHSVIPIAADAESLPQEVTTSWDGDTLYDQACVILEGSPSAVIHCDNVKVDRMVKFSGCPDRKLSLYELATVLQFISAHGLRAVSIGLDTACETYSKWFSRATLSMLSPVIMRSAFRRMTPDKGPAATEIEITLQRSVDAWLASTFKQYPLDDVASENHVSSVLFQSSRGSCRYHVGEAV
ncbi:hypothetical protein EV363DRAFT_1400648 [Boletus edulis]|uniref:Uncharacterized protein n=1 Tax=Boletus edulis BED1 TaxID=1328754 RepID=A0AAD4BP29_BOLED|nr:hypothetical protein EV363DRAFT_1400648 [Boletus edulis]KAF8435979.1 hypothetical protein L210DRAFT_198429 [Boletus edulis BED1]